jgi:hypothetical protein
VLLWGKENRSKFNPSVNLRQLAGPVAMDITDLPHRKVSTSTRRRKKIRIHFAKHVGSSRRVVTLFIEGETSQALIFGNAARFIRFEA